MVDFAPSDDVKAIRAAIREFIARETKPFDEKWPGFLADEQAYLRPDGRIKDEVHDAIKTIRRKSAEQGFYACYMPTEYGGAEIGFTGAYFLLKDIASHGLGFNQFVLAGVEGPCGVLTHLTAEQQERWLQPLMRGEQSTCFALTEPEAGSDVGNLQTKALREGDEFVLNGQKTFITNAPYADTAIVFARTDPESTGHDGISCIMVDMKTEGVRTGPVQQSIIADGLQSEIFFEDARVPVENVVGKEGMGFYYALENIGMTRVAIGGLCVGLGEWCLERSVSYAQQRHAFGKPIAKKQAIQFMIADSAMDVATADHLTLNCCWKLDHGEQAIRESSMVKVYTTEALFRVADRAVQIHGGNGIMRELPLERVFRWARMIRIPEGTSEIQRWTIAKTYGL